MYDAIIIGARCAGAPTGMLLAQKGHRVLVIDRARFPSDTISTHYITADGTARLAEWGLLDRVIATGVQPYNGLARSMQGVTIPAAPGDPVGIAPRRTELDKVLVDAAVEAGVELWQGTSVGGLITEDGTVTGIRGQRDGQAFEERARVVIGADGRESFVARAVGAEEYNEATGHTAGYYSYFRNWAHNGPEFHLGGGVAHFAFPTNHGEVCVAVEMVAERFKSFREDVEQNYIRSLEAFEPFAARLKGAEKTSKVFGLAPHKSFYRKPFGQGWALVGDAGYYRDPLLGQGINDAFRDAEGLACALDDVFAGRAQWADALGAYEKARNEATAMIYGLTNLLCQDLDPSPEIARMMAAGPAKEAAAALAE